MRYKLFGKSGLRVSELCLGTMTFGEAWGKGANKEESQKIFDLFVKNGGNFIDTANRYTEGESEKFVGEFIHSDRDYFVLASKYTLYDRRDDVNASGNHRKNMMRSVDESLKRLNTDYLDLFWVHMWDFTTPVEEVMRGLDDLISMGKIHYIGISDTPAWVIANANTIAQFRNWTSFVGLQIEYSLIQRSAERDLLPMAKHFDMAITPWSPLGAGMLTGKYMQGIPEGVRLSEQSVKLNDRNKEIVEKLVGIAKEANATPAQVALRWLLEKDTQIIPIIGARKVAQLEDSLGCLNIPLSSTQIEALNEISAIELGFPHDFLQSPGVLDVCFADNKDNIIFKR